MRWRARSAAALVVAFAAVACGCGGGGQPATSTSAERTTPAPVARPPDPLDRCESAGPGWQPLEVTGTTGAPAARLGSGRFGVVFANDSDNDGARRVVLVGASVGARAVLQAGVEHPCGVVGLVALSAERSVSTSPGDLLPDMRHVRLPVLSIGSRGDPLTTYGRDTRAFHRTLANDRMLLVGGSAHGVELLRGRHAPQARGAILRFLRSL
jgi:dienelactone hydrolase